MFRFSRRSYESLNGVRPELIAVATLALQRTRVDFMVTEGLRTKERQRRLYEEGKSQTLNSKHLDGRAIDIVAIGEKVGVTWEWTYYDRIATAFKSAAEDLGVKITWGGDWRTFKDGTHFELA